jgi:hypothetical protein
MNGPLTLFTFSDSSSDQWKHALAEVLSQHLPGGTQENHENPYSGWPVSERGTELDTLWMEVLGYYCNINLLGQ